VNILSFLLAFLSLPCSTFQGNQAVKPANTDIVYHIGTHAKVQSHFSITDSDESNNIPSHQKKKRTKGVEPLPFCLNQEATYRITVVSGKPELFSKIHLYTFSLFSNGKRGPPVPGFIS
jgi:hypothetical protein